jgi:hypothetical protein
VSAGVSPDTIDERQAAADHGPHDIKHAALLIECAGVTSREC